jgi:hypothetical protein
LLKKIVGWWRLTVQEEKLEGGALVEEKEELGLKVEKLGSFS